MKSIYVSQKEKNQAIKLYWMLGHPGTCLVLKIVIYIQSPFLEKQAGFQFKHYFQKTHGIALSVVRHSGGAVAELILFPLDFGDSKCKSAVSCPLFPVGGGFELRPLPFHHILLYH